MTLKTLLILLTLWLPVAFGSNGPVAARVNGEEISQFRLERYFAEYLEDQGRALGSIRNPKAYKQLRQKALDALIETLGHRISNLRKEDALALGELNDRGAVAALQAAQDDGDPEVRKAVRIALSQLQ